MALVFGVILQPTINVYNLPEVKLHFETRSTICFCSRVAQYQELKTLSVKVQAHSIQTRDLLQTGWTLKELWSLLIMGCLSTDMSLVISWCTTSSPCPSHATSSPSSRSNPWRVMHWMKTTFSWVQHALPEHYDLFPGPVPEALQPD